MPGKILTLHPAGKPGVNIDQDKYDFIKSAILKTIREKREISYQDLDKKLNQSLKGKFDGSISWYVVTVKLDLEARNLIRRVPGTSPHKMTLA